MYPPSPLASRLSQGINGVHYGIGTTPPCHCCHFKNCVQQFSKTSWWTRFRIFHINFNWMKLCKQCCCSYKMSDFVENLVRMSSSIPQGNKKQFICSVVSPQSQLDNYALGLGLGLRGLDLGLGLDKNT